MTETPILTVHYSPRQRIGFSVIAKHADQILKNGCDRADFIKTLDRLLNAVRKNSYPFTTVGKCSGCGIPAENFSETYMMWTCDDCNPAEITEALVEHVMHPNGLW